MSASKISAAPILLVFAFLALSGASSPAHLEPPFLYMTPDEWPFENKPVAKFDEMPSVDRDKILDAVEDLPSEEYCPTLLAFRYQYYQNIYPRFGLIADDPRAYQLFLHNAVERSVQPKEICPPSQLMERIVDSGTHRCNLNLDQEYFDPVLRDDIDKVIELVEARHASMVEAMISTPSLTRSNSLHADTEIYLLELNVVPDWAHGGSDIMLEDLFERDPNRYDFIIEAARRNDFRAVLRTNPPCWQDWPEE